MPKPTNAAAAKPSPVAAEETIDMTATDTSDAAEDSQEGAQEASTKERQPSLPLTDRQQQLILRTIVKMRKGVIPGGVTPSSVAAHVKTLPEFADIAGKITAVKISSTMNTMRRQREKDIKDGQAARARGEDVPWLEQLEANEAPDFDRQHSARLAPSAFLDALLAED